MRPSFLAVLAVVGAAFALPGCASSDGGHGNAHYDRVISGISVACGEHPVVGRSVVLHAKADDLTSQPAGAAGDRIAWGVIGVAAPAPAAK